MISFQRIILKLWFVTDSMETVMINALLKLEIQFNYHLHTQVLSNKAMTVFHGDTKSITNTNTNIGLNVSTNDYEQILIRYFRINIQLNFFLPTTS